VLFVRQDSGEALLPALSRNLTFSRVAVPGLGWTLAGLGFALVVLVLVRRASEVEPEDCLSELCRPFWALSLPIFLTLACGLSLAVSPSFPYGSNLAVSLCLEGAFFALCTLVVFGVLLAQALVRLLGVWQRQLPSLAILGIAMLCFTAATPGRFYDEGVGQGNMFKYVRMAQTLGGTGTLNIERAEENADPTLSGFVSFIPGWISSYVDASLTLVSQPSGERKATRVNRSMFRSVDGGVYYINAPGPGILLTPAYLVDRVLERWFGWERQVAIIVFWQLIGALLVLEIVWSTREMAFRSAGTLTALGVAVAVPFLFYTFQIYPELPGGLLILFAFRKLAIDASPTGKGVFAASMALAALPWLHQKYSVLAAVLGIYAAVKLLTRTPGGIRHHPYKVVLLAAPLAISAYSIFLYNHALTGSLAPTATFEAVERSSFEPWNFFKGMSGLLFDRENGLFVFAPIYVAALVGARAFFLRERKLFLPLTLVLASYLIVIASFPYWPGAISTMGRYILSVLPLFALPLAYVVDRALTDGRLAGVLATLMAASLAYSVSFASDLIPSYQPWIFWERALYSDPHQYLPSFLSDGVLGSGPAHLPKFAVLAGLVAVLVLVLRDRVYRDPVSVGDESAGFHRHAVASALAVLMLAVASGTVLEHWPSNGTDKSGPVFRDSRSLSRSRTLATFGEHGFEGDGVWVEGGGSAEFLLRTREPLAEMQLRFRNGPNANTVVFRERGEQEVSFELAGGAHVQTVRVRKPYRFDGPRGERFLYAFKVTSRGSFVPKDEGISDDERRLGTHVRVR